MAEGGASGGLGNVTRGIEKQIRPTILNSGRSSRSRHPLLKPTSVSSVKGVEFIYATIIVLIAYVQNIVGGTKSGYLSNSSADQYSQNSRMS